MYKKLTTRSVGAIQDWFTQHAPRAAAPHKSAEMRPNLRVAHRRNVRRALRELVR